MPSYFESLLIQCFEAGGVDPEIAAKAAHIVVDIDNAMARTPKERAEMWEQDAHILRLRGDGLSSTVIAIRLGIHRQRVFEAIKRHQCDRRAAFRAAS